MQANWGWKNMYGPAFEILRRAVEIDKNYYPESMHRTVVVNAPPLMSAVWSLVKPMLPPRTRGKVRGLSTTTHTPADTWPCKGISITM